MSHFDELPSTPKGRLKKNRRVNSPPVSVKRFKGISNGSARNQKYSLAIKASKCESPPLPCNQMEYLCESGSNDCPSNDIPCSQIETCLIDINDWESFELDEENKYQEPLTEKSVQETEQPHNNLFSACVEENLNENHDEVILTKKEFKHNIEESFDNVNQSIIKNNDHESSLFETQDSFLLDIKDSCFKLDQLESNLDKSSIIKENKSSNNFYDLPLVVKGLFKSYRNIEKFYDWQEECLNLDAIKQRRNLIYALPTSGGKTLVAEVLMLREVLNRKQNALFILPFVAIVQEKIWALSPFALQLDFLLEEYAGGKGHLPPKKRRKKNSIYIATIEKGLALVRSLIEENRLHELGLIVVDELHLIGEPGRGGVLETLLTTVVFANKGIQIVGMSATIGNLPEIGQFLNAEIFERQFRPVELTEYVKLGDRLYKIVWSSQGIEVVPDRHLKFDYSAAGSSLDPDRLGGLVAEVVPKGSCLIFCPTKRNCENVAALLCKLQRREMLQHRVAERTALAAALQAEGAAAGLARAAASGVAYHHAGLTGDERVLLEQAFRAGVVSVLCCTSTLAAGVNLPAARVLVRAPRVGREPLALPAYKQMAGRAGRAGVSAAGDSIIICTEREWSDLRKLFECGMPAAKSVLRDSVPALFLGAIALNLATTRARLGDLLNCTLLAIENSSSTNMKEICDESLRSLLKDEAIEVVGQKPSKDCGGDYEIPSDAGFVVSKLGRAAIKGALPLGAARRLVREAGRAARRLQLRGPLQLLLLAAPDGALRPDYAHYYRLYSSLDEEGILTARIIGISENNAVRMLTGKPILNVSESILCRFYLALMLRDLYRQMPVAEVATKYCVPRGTVQSVVASAAAFASSAARVCDAVESPPLWPFAALFERLAPRLRHCANPDLHDLLDLPGVRLARAVQLSRGGFGSVQLVARAAPRELSAAVPHLSLSAAAHLVSAARMMLIEKVENLRAEAEEVMDGLNA